MYVTEKLYLTEWIIYVTVQIYLFARYGTSRLTHKKTENLVIAKLYFYYTVKMMFISVTANVSVEYNI